MLHFLVLRVGEHNMGRVREIEKMGKIRKIEKIKRVRGVEETIVEIK